LKIVTVLGARPQFIKASTVSREIAKRGDIQEIIVHTGQHFDRNMSDIFFQEMEIPQPNYFLAINSLSHGAMTGRMLEKIEEILLAERPDGVLVYGDTNSTLAGALAAKKLHIKIVHVEAGLRGFNMDIPEEINRIVTDRISDLLCCPTDHAVNNLRREGFDHFDCTVVKTGDVMQDAALYYSDLSARRSTIIERLGLANGDFALCTIHRAENTDDRVRLTAIIKALNTITREMRVVLPLHPRTKKILQDLDVPADFLTIEPVGYLDMLELLKNSRIVLTDSGGLQKEAFFLAKPCITLRDEMEWMELFESGVNLLVGSDEKRIIHGFHEMLGRQTNFNHDFYGNGKAAGRIVDEILART
jgi:UDP-GlcNAc3NAcA epimerase